MEYTCVHEAQQLIQADQYLFTLKQQYLHDYTSVQGSSDNICSFIICNAVQFHKQA